VKRAAAVVLLALLAACGGGGGNGNSLPPTNQSTATPTPSAPVDDWTTYAHDVSRTGYETQPTGITSSTVSSLTLAWRNTPDPSCATAASAIPVVADEASPIVAGGYVYYADACGYVAALSTGSGDIVWHTQLTVPSLGGPLGTPTLDAARDLLIVPVHGSNGEGCTQSTIPCPNPASGGYLAALDAQNGAVVWQQTPLAAGNLRGEPFVLHGIVYEGLAGGDFFSGYTNGGIFALDESTGSAIGTLPLVQAAPTGETYDGGGSWSPISYDGKYLYFGFGNTRLNDGLQDSVVQFNPTTRELSPNFDLQTFDGVEVQGNNDEDVSGGELLWGGDLYFEGKNGRYYGYPLATPTLPFANVLVNSSGQPGVGAIWTPTTDGNAIAVSSGYDTLPPSPYSSQLQLYSVGSGSERCEKTATNSALYSYAAFVSGIGFVGFDNQVATGSSTALPIFIAFDDNCNILWQDTSQTDILAYFYGGPAVVPSGVYAIDDMGNVYAWKLPSASSTSVAKRSQSTRSLIRPGVRSSIRSTLYMRRSAHAIL
jgi:hypothetical protein